MLALNSDYKDMGKRNYTLSICIVTHNNEKYIKRAIKSALLQGGEESEIVIINDGSTDRTGEICDCFSCADYSIKVIHSEWGGLVHGRNTAILNAGGKYLTFLDGDDWLDDYMFVDAIDLMDKDESVDIYVFGMKNNWDGGKEEYIINPGKSRYIPKNERSSVPWVDNNALIAH